MPIADETDVRIWFAEYLDVLTACFRGEREVEALLDYYGVPALLTTDAGLVAMTSAEEVVGFLGQQADALREAGYHQTDVVDSEVTIVNASTALYRVALVRRREDGGELGQLGATYLIADGPQGRRISAVALS